MQLQCTWELEFGFLAITSFTRQIAWLDDIYHDLGGYGGGDIMADILSSKSPLYRGE